MAIGAVVGPIVGFAAEMIFGADDQYIAHHVIIAIVLGGPMGFIAGALVGTLRRPPRP